MSTNTMLPILSIKEYMCLYVCRNKRNKYQWPTHMYTNKMLPILSISIHVLMHVQKQNIPF